jgi:regulation of enolase protein 1 (concanavalin A-like superfamily)
MCEKVVHRLCYILLLVGLAGSTLADMVAYYPMDEGSGSAVKDASAKGHDATITGAVNWVQSRPDLDFALDFPGTSGNYVGAGTWDPSESTGQVSVAAWIKWAGANASNTYQGIVTKCDGVFVAIRWQLTLSNTDGSVGFGFGGGAPIYPAPAPPIGEWQHVAFSHDGTAATMYINGVNAGTSSITLGTGTSAAICIGALNLMGTADAPFNGTIDEVYIFDKALSAAEAGDVMQGAFASPYKSRSPNPSNFATDVFCGTALSWTAGKDAVSHDVYLGTSAADVEIATKADSRGVLAVAGQADSTYEPTDRLEFGQTYYWRVDEVNSTSPTKPTKGDVWSFSVEPALYPIEGVVATASLPTAEGSGGPEVLVDGSGLTNGLHGVAPSTIWVGQGAASGPIWLQFDFDRVYKLYGIHIWNYNGSYEFALGFGFKGITIEYAATPNEWMTLGDYELARAPGVATYAGKRIDLDGVCAQSIRINVSSTQSGSGEAGLSEIRFLYKPVRARLPQPANGATQIDPAVSLNWRPGREAASHQISFGPDADLVAEGGALIDTVAAGTYSPGALTLGTTYYWKIDEVNDLETPASWAGDVWNFSTPEYISIDNFDSYTDDEGNRIYQTWLDGYDTPTNGSQVGHDNGPYAEKTVVRSGQAMPFYYTNTSTAAGTVSYSEAERTFAPPQNWTVNGADTLSLYYRGQPTGFVRLAEDNIVMNGIGSDIWGTADQFRFVYKQLTGNGSIVARVEYLDYTNEWAKAGVMIRETLEADSVLVDGVVSADKRACMQWRTGRAVDMGSPDASSATVVGSFEFPHWVKLTRTGDVFKVQHSADGVTWLDLVPATAGDPTSVTQAMPQTVYIGLVVCSHNANAVAGAQFTGIATTGNVSGQWQSAAIGVEQPAGNGLDQFYLTVEDSLGKKATFVHPSATAVGMGSWQQWTIPLSDITAAGVKANSVKKLYLGVGDQSKPSQNASGLIYIDDLAFGHPAD